MKKVGIVSCYFKNNYGSLLQAYATQQFLNSNNIPNVTVKIEHNKDLEKNKKKFYISQLTNFNFIKTKFGMVKLKFYKNINSKLKKNIAIRNKKFAEFRDLFSFSQSCSDYKELGSMADEEFSNVVVGSDQLWLPVNVVSDYYTLNWVSDKVNKISYATSFGVSKIPTKYIELYDKFLKRIKYLSVREARGKNLIKEITGQDAQLVCDPTLLLTKEDWDEIATKKRIIKEKYILCYFLGNNIEYLKFAKRLKNETGFKIVSLNHVDEFVKYSERISDYAPYDVGPKEWINLIKNAEYVCTDSFHCTVFSIIFNKEFFCFKRHNNKNLNSTNSRLDSLLNTLEINNRSLRGNENVAEIIKLKINYNKVNKNVSSFKQRSQKWFLDSIIIDKEDKNHVEINNKKLCCGCTACKNICPKNAITMVSDEEGFLYPKVDEKKCIKCGLCKKVCPITNSQKKNAFEQKTYLFQNKKENIRSDSSSGGFFTALGEYVIENNGIVFGASFDDNFIVKHTKCDNVNDLQKFRKSKYVQSDLTNVFEDVKNYLNENKLVCFSGTPCQVEGIKAYLRKDYDNLILVDIMCHSVPSPLFFEKYKDYVLKKLKADKILEINFRDKSKYGYKYPFMTVKTNNGTYSEAIDTDPYLRAFFGDYSVRPSCYFCHFKTQKRVSDFTIWDCFNVNEIDKTFDDDKGTTRVIVQSQKGQKIIDKLNNVKMKEIPVDLAVNNVKEMTNSVRYNVNREDFFAHINDENLIDEYFPINFKTKINSFIRKFLSNIGLYSKVKSFAKIILNR